MFVFQRRSVRQYKPVEYPIFKRQDAPFTSPHGITHMVASNGCISLVQPGNIIYRFHLDNPRGAAERKIMQYEVHMGLLLKLKKNYWHVYNILTYRC